jgi:hypothetical protein
MINRFLLSRMEKLLYISCSCWAPLLWSHPTVVFLCRHTLDLFREPFEQRTADWLYNLFDIVYVYGMIADLWGYRLVGLLYIWQYMYGMIADLWGYILVGLLYIWQYMYVCYHFRYVRLYWSDGLTHGSPIIGYSVEFRTNYDQTWRVHPQANRKFWLVETFIYSFIHYVHHRLSTS